jgi:hypothetical protein
MFGSVQHVCSHDLQAVHEVDLPRVIGFGDSVTQYAFDGLRQGWLAQVLSEFLELINIHMPVSVKLRTLQLFSCHCYRSCGVGIQKHLQIASLNDVNNAQLRFQHCICCSQLTHTAAALVYAAHGSDSEGLWGVH